MPDLISVVLLALHLMCMNVASAGPLLCCWLGWLAWRGEASSGRAAAWLAGASFLALLAGTLLGLLLGAARWNDDYARLWLETLRYKGIMAICEWLFSVVLMGIAWPLWRSPSQHTSIKMGRMVLSFLAGTNLLYHFPFLFTIAAELRTTAVAPEPLDAAAFRSWMFQPAILPRVVHVMLASPAMCGTALLGVTLRWRREGIPLDEVLLLQRRAAWWALAPSLLQIVVGLWLIASLPGSQQQRVMGEDGWGTAMLGGSIFITVFLLQDLAALAFGEDRPLLVHRSMSLMMLIVLLMSGVLWRLHG